MVLCQVKTLIQALLIAVSSQNEKGKGITLGKSYEVSWDRMLLEHSIIDEHVSWMWLFICDWCNKTWQAGKISPHFMKDGWTFSNHFLKLNSGSLEHWNLHLIFFFPPWNILCGIICWNSPRISLEILIQILKDFLNFPPDHRPKTIVNMQTQQHCHSFNKYWRHQTLW